MTSKPIGIEYRVLLHWIFHSQFHSSWPSAFIVDIFFVFSIVWVYFKYIEEIRRFDEVSIDLSKQTTLYIKSKNKKRNKIYVRDIKHKDKFKFSPSFSLNYISNARSLETENIHQNSQFSSKGLNVFFFFFLVFWKNWKNNNKINIF